MEKRDVVELPIGEIDSKQSVIVENQVATTERPTGFGEDRLPCVVKRLPVLAQHADGGDGFGGAALPAHEQVQLVHAGLAQSGVPFLLAQDVGAESEILAGEGVGGIALERLRVGVACLGETRKVFEEVALEIVVFGLGGIQLDGVGDLFQRIGKLLLLDERLRLREEGGRGAAQPPEGVVGALFVGRGDRRVALRLAFIFDRPRLICRGAIALGFGMSLRPGDIDHKPHRQRGDDGPCRRRRGEDALVPLHEQHNLPAKARILRPRGEAGLPRLHLRGELIHRLVAPRLLHRERLHRHRAHRRWHAPAGAMRQRTEHPRIQHVAFHCRRIFALALCAEIRRRSKLAAGNFPQHFVHRLPLHRRMQREDGVEDRAE